ncbi:MAG: hypothetical protein ABFS56_33805 [Pseudomonadota bacterium]
MQKKIFVENEKLTKEYQRYFNEPGTIAYYASSIDDLYPKEKYYYLFLENTGKKNNPVEAGIETAEVLPMLVR